MIVQELIHICIKLQFGARYFNCSKFCLFLSDITCGKLFCQGGSNNLPWKGRIVTFLTCKTFDPEESSQEIGMVANGTKCGNKKVSWNYGFYSKCYFSFYFVFYFSRPFCVLWEPFSNLCPSFGSAWISSILFNKYQLCI